MEMLLFFDIVRIDQQSSLYKTFTLLTFISIGKVYEHDVVIIYVLKVFFVSKLEYSYTEIEQIPELNVCHKVTSHLASLNIVFFDNINQTAFQTVSSVKKCKIQ